VRALRVGGEGTAEFSPRDWSQVETALLALDGRDRPVVFLVGPNEEYLAIMSTPDDRYNCSFWDPRTGSGRVLQTPGAGSAVVPIYLNEVQEDDLIGRGMMLRAARRYVESGELDPDLPWRDM
jgi:hypothetical protein